MAGGTTVNLLDMNTTDEVLVAVNANEAVALTNMRGSQCNKLLLLLFVSTVSSATLLLLGGVPLALWPLYCPLNIKDNHERGKIILLVQYFVI